MSLRKWGLETLVNTSTGSFSGASQAGSVVTPLADGRYVVGWTSGDQSTNDGLGLGPMLQIFNADGSKAGAEFSSWPLPVPSGIDSLFDLVTLQNGTLLQLYGIGGNLTSNNVTLGVSGSNLTLGSSLAASLSANYPRAADANQTGLVMYYGQLLLKFDAANNSLWQVPTSYTYTGAESADVALLQNGNVVLTYFVSQQVFFTVYNGTTGAVVTSGIAVSPTANSAHGTPVVTALAGGGFVIAYRDAFGLAAGAGPDPSGTGIVHQVFNADGSIASLPLLTNTYTSGIQEEPAIAALKDGGFIVVYASDGDIRAQVFNADGSKRGTEVLVNTTTSNSQTEPSVEVLSDGRVVVTWTDNSQTGGDTDGTAIRQQILDPRDGVVFGTDYASVSETLYGNDLLGDELNGLAGNDTMYGMAGSDVLYGGNGNDLLYGGRGDDTMYGDAGVDRIWGDLGDDEAYGGAGDDILYGSLGADLLAGEAGTLDTASYQSSTAGVTVNLTTGVNTGGYAQDDVLTGIEQIWGSNFNDTLTGDGNTNYFWGGGGTNTMNGGGGDDSFTAGTGNDTFNGDGGNDTVLYGASNAAVTINLATNANSGGFAAGDTFNSIEKIIGSANYGDSLTGDAFTNYLNGNGGNDTIRGGGGADQLVGSTGSDTFVFAPGDSGQLTTNLDTILDFTKGVVGTGDKIDFAPAALVVGGNPAAATATIASINASTGVATFFAGSGTTLADALADITSSFAAGGQTAGEFAFFRVNGAGPSYLLVSDGAAGVTANDVLIQLSNVTSVNSINLTGGDLTILT